MSVDWPVKTLDDVCEKITDGAHSSPKSVSTGKPMASVKDLTRFGVELKGARHISIEDFDKLVKQGCQPEIGDVLIAKDGNSALDTVCNIKQPLGAVLLSSVAILRPDPEKIDSDFLKYYFSSQDTINYLKNNFISGAAIPRVILKDLKKAQIKLPPLGDQKKISSVLGSLDNKIELNRQINKTLEKMALAIFKSWFVDFEPVKAKIKAKESGQDPERAAMCAISGAHGCTNVAKARTAGASKNEKELDRLPPDQLAQLRATAALFPDELIDSERGTIPKGWEVASMKDCCMRVESGGTPKRNERSYWNGNIRWLSSGEVRDVIVLDTKEKITEAGLNHSSAKLWPPGSTVVAMYGATAGQVCLVAKEMTANQACCALIPKNGCQSYIFLSARRSIKDLFGKASGSAQQNLNKSLVSDHKSLLPSQKILENFEQITSPFLERWIKNTEQCSVLSQLRDTLLPKLLSGEISLADAREKMMEAV